MKLTRSHLLHCVVAGALSILPAGPVSAAVPAPVSYQGYLSDAVGTPTTAVLSISFSLYTVSVGGTPIWTETQVVSVDQGLFTVNLGAIPGNEFPSGAFETSLFLGINVASDGEMTPRHAFDSVPFAKKAADADTLQGISPADLDQAGDVATLQGNSVLQLDNLLSLGGGGVALLETDLELQAPGGQSRVEINAEGALSGGEISLYSAENIKTLALRADNGAGSRFSMFNDANLETVLIRSSLSGAGELSLGNDSGAIRARLDGDSSNGGSLLLSAADGSSTVFLAGQAPDDAGLIEVRNNLSATRVAVDGEDNGGGRIDVRQSNGANGILIRGEEFSGGTDGGVVEVYANDGTETIELDGGPSAGTAFIFVNGSVSADVKNAVVTMSNGEKRLFYTTESPEVWFEDVGSGQLENGFAVVRIEPMYRETITVDKANPLRVMVTLTDDCNGVYVRKFSDRFEVHELNGGRSNATFDYKIIGKRKGYEDIRLEPLRRLSARQGEPLQQ